MHVCMYACTVRRCRLWRGRYRWESPLRASSISLQWNKTNVCVLSINNYPSAWPPTIFFSLFYVGKILRIVAAMSFLVMLFAAVVAVGAICCYCCYLLLFVAIAIICFHYCYLLICVLFVAFCCYLPLLLLFNATRCYLVLLLLFAAMLLFAAPAGICCYCC